MSLTRKMLPIGVENFEKLRRNDMYYVEKTEIIAAAVRNGRQISELAEAGIDIVTCGLAVYEASFEHPFTTHGLGMCREAWDSTATE